MTKLALSIVVDDVVDEWLAYVLARLPSADPDEMRAKLTSIATRARGAEADELPDLEKEFHHIFASHEYDHAEDEVIQGLKREIADKKAETDALRAVAARLRAATAKLLDEAGGTHDFNRGLCMRCGRPEGTERFCLPSDM